LRFPKKTYELKCVSSATENSYSQPVFGMVDPKAMEESDVRQLERTFLIQFINGHWILREVGGEDGGGNVEVSPKVDINISGPNLHISGNQPTIEGLQ